MHFLHIWIVPDARGLGPAYGQRAIDRAAAHRQFQLLASKDGRDSSLLVHQDVDLWMTELDVGAEREPGYTWRAAASRCTGSVSRKATAPR